MTQPGDWLPFCRSTETVFWGLGYWFIESSLPIFVGQQLEAFCIITFHQEVWTKSPLRGRVLWTSYSLHKDYVWGRRGPKRHAHMPPHGWMILTKCWIMILAKFHCQIAILEKIHRWILILAQIHHWILTLIDKDKWSDPVRSNIWLKWWRPYVANQEDPHWEAPHGRDQQRREWKIKWGPYKGPIQVIVWSHELCSPPKLFIRLVCFS